MLVVGASVVVGVLAFVAARFTKPCKLSDVIFAALGLDRPSQIDLYQRLRETRKTFSHTDQFKYHPYASGVYKY
jgi:hypothetical protein